MDSRITIIEDEEKDFEELKSLLEQYEKEKKQTFLISHFWDAVKFLNDYKPNSDIVFMDINLPYLNGIEAAHKLRGYDPNVTIIFITHSSQYAVMGYEVNALDYLIKPVTYSRLSTSLTKAISLIEKRKKTPTLTLKTEDGYLQLSTTSIIFVETMNHVLIYHTDTSTYSAYGSLRQLEKSLPKGDFSRCNSCYLVNLRFVNSIDKDFVSIGGTKLRMSRLKKKSFADDFTLYLKKAHPHSNF